MQGFPGILYLYIWSKVLHLSKIIILCYINLGNYYPHIYLHAIHILNCFTTVTSLRCFFYSMSWTFVSHWYIKLYWYFMSYPALSSCYTNSIPTLMWHSSSNSTFSADFIGFSMVWLILSKLVWKPLFMSLAPYYVGIQLYYSCACKVYFSLHWKYLWYGQWYSAQPLWSYGFHA